MTKRNFFGDVIHTPEDHPADLAVYAEDQKAASGLYNARISEDPEFKWCAEVGMDEADGELAVQGFESQEALTKWLIEAGVPTDGIEVEG